jgi:hypothetical protein
MENEKYQKELFEFEFPKKASARFGNIFPRTDLAITLTPEKMVFAAIGMIMLMVVFFALGVEKGKSAARAKFTEMKTAVRQAAAPAMPVKPALTAVKARAVFDKTKPYMVVAASFLREDLALREVDKLKMAGLDAFIYYGEPYYLACVGSFQSKDSAQKILNKVKQIRKDAYVRLR